MENPIASCLQSGNPDVSLHGGIEADGRQRLDETIDFLVLAFGHRRRRSEREIKHS